MSHKHQILIIATAIGLLGLGAVHVQGQDKYSGLTSDTTALETVNGCVVPGNSGGYLNWSRMTYQRPSPTSSRGTTSAYVAPSRRALASQSSEKFWLRTRHFLQEAPGIAPGPTAIQVAIGSHITSSKKIEPRRLAPAWGRRPQGWSPGRSLHKVSNQKGCPDASGAY